LIQTYSMIVSIYVLKKDGKFVVILGDFDKNDLQKETTCNAQLLTCVENFKSWCDGKTKVDVIIPLRPDILTEKPRIAKEELQKLMYRLPKWIDAENKEITLKCVDTREYRYATPG